ERHHRIEMQPLGLTLRQRRTYDPGRMTDDERHLLRAAERGRNKQIAFVLAIVVVGHGDDLALGKCRKGRLDALLDVAHVHYLPNGPLLFLERPSRALAHL